MKATFKTDAERLEVLAELERQAEETRKVIIGLETAIAYTTARMQNFKKAMDCLDEIERTNNTQP